MPNLLQDTIAAPASASGPAYRCLVRISGRDLVGVLNRVLPAARDFLRTRVPSRFTTSILLAGWPPFELAVYYWPNSRSFTGESLAELHLPGAQPLVQALLEAIYAAGGRPAEPGEFTQRAFMNGRIDLLQAEAVLGVIDARSQPQLDLALGQLAGGISGEMRTIREELLLHLADLEAGLDFVEEDIDFVHREELQLRLQRAVERLEEISAQGQQRMLPAGRPKVVLAGLPNAGKSTLFNALTNSPAALVSGEAGTTRDYLVRTLSLDGIEFDLIDTAGWEQASPEELLRAMDAQRGEQYAQADLILWCAAADLTNEEYTFDRERWMLCSKLGARMFRVVTKADNAESSAGPNGSLLGHGEVLFVSVHSHAGLDDLRDTIVRQLQQLDDARAALIGSSAARCSHTLQQALDAARQALNLTTGCAGDELIALELRSVLDALGEIVGEIYTDDILDRIFSRFCIGK